MSTYQIRKPSFLEVSRNQSTPTTSLNTTDISMNNTNLESYKKALHSIVKRLNKTPSASSKTSLKRSDSKLNQTQQPVYNTTLLNTSNSSKKYHISHASASGNRNQSCSRRSHSNDGSYKNNKESLNKSMQETYIKKGSFSSNISKSISINKLDKAESHDVDDLVEGELLSGDNNYRRNSALNATILHDADLNNLDGDGDKKLRDLVHQYQLRDAIHRQEITKLKKSNELLRTHVYELEKELDKSKKSKDSEKRYINKLETELSQFKERARVEAAEKKSLQSTMSEQKESQYIKAIEELKSQLTSMSSEKKLVEHLLKNALTQHDQNKSDKPPSSSSSGTHKGLDASILAATSGKYSTNAGGRPKADAFARKGSAIKIFNDENDYASYSQSQTANSSFIANSVKMSKDFDTVKEVKPVNSVFGNGNMNRVLQEGSVNNAVEPVDLPTEGDEAFPTKVFHPQPNEKSLKERIDLNRFKLDLSVISKNRKVG